jgi:hypothetical protein
MNEKNKTSKSGLEIDCGQIKIVDPLGRDGRATIAPATPKPTEAIHCPIKDGAN